MNDDFGSFFLGFGSAHSATYPLTAAERKALREREKRTIGFVDHSKSAPGRAAPLKRKRTCAKIKRPSTDPKGRRTV